MFLNVETQCYLYEDQQQVKWIYGHTNVSKGCLKINWSYILELGNRRTSGETYK